MLDMGSESRRKTIFSDAFDDFLHRLITDDMIRVGEYVVGAMSRCGDICRHFCFEGNATDEHDHGMNDIGRQLQQFAKRLRVLVVLPQRILKLILAFENLLRPHRLAFSAKYPACHVLFFDNKNPMRTDDDMVDLRCPILCGKRDIMENRICTLGETKPENEPDDLLAKPALEQSRAKDQAKRGCKGKQ